MILYYSATGNSKYVAERIAEATGDVLVSLREARGKTLRIDAGERIGVVCPVIFWDAPPTPAQALQSLRFEIASGKSPFAYTVVTYGATTGAAQQTLGRILKEKGIEVSARHAIKMVDTCSFAFDVSNGAANKRREDAAETAIDRMIARVESRKVGNFDRTTMPAFSLAPMHAYYDATRKTAKFSVSPRCIRCGLCARQCPTKTIKMQGGRPVWIHELCDLCLGCLHRCPAFAIQFGSKTESHGQYTNPNTTL